MSLLTRLFLLVAVAVLPAILIQAHTEIQYRRAREAEIHSLVLQQARLAATDQDRVIEGARQVLIALAQLPSVKNRDGAACHAYLTRLVPAYPYYSSINVLDPDGRPFCSSIADPPPAFSAGDRAYVRQAIATRRFAMGEYTLGVASHVPILPMAYPVVSDQDGTVSAVVALGLNPQWLQRWVGSRALPAGVVLTVADRTGTVLARSQGAAQVGRKLPDRLLPLLGAATDGTLETRDASGASEIIGYVPLRQDPEGLFLLVEMSRDRAFAELDYATRLGIVLLAISVAVALAAAGVIGRRFIRQPLEVLLAATARWREGDFGARTGLPASNAELDRLGNAFDAMAAAIEERDRRLRSAEERALRREREFSRLVIESSDVGILAYDREFSVTLLNPALEARFGVAADAAVGRPFPALLPSLWGTPFGAAMRRAVTGEATAAQDEPYELPELGNRAGRCEASHAPLRDADDTIIGGIAFLRDTTERHAIEERLRQSQKMEAVGQLTGGIAHDFNNLLTIVIGNLDMLARRLGPNEPALQGLVSAAARGANRAAILTQRLLAFSRRQPLEPGVTDVNGLVSGMVDLLRRTLGESIRIETDLSERLWSCFVDPNQLENALLNLAINARDAMTGGGRLSITTENRRCAEIVTRDGTLPAGDYVMLAVADNGTGMKPEVAAKAFDPFFTTKGVGEGSGLGLSMVYGFVRQSHGHVEIDSEVGRGTTVRILLPRHADAPRAAAAAAGEAPRHRGRERLLPKADAGETVLFVEDNEDVRRYGVNVLRELGYHVIEAAEAEAALRILAGPERIDVLFTDVGLPGVDGWALAGRALALRPSLKIVYTTGYAEGAIARDSMPGGSGSGGGVHLITKPFDIDTLAIKIRKVLGEEEARIEG
jgi:PAS domain S-box-containing protein